MAKQLRPDQIAEQIKKKAKGEVRRYIQVLEGMASNFARMAAQDDAAHVRAVRNERRRELYRRRK